MISRLLALLFPPRLPSQIPDWFERVECHAIEEGSAGPAKRKRYRDGIERWFAENS
jgi:hypothetical protein